VRAQTDSLLSRNDAAAKQAILNFVSAVTREGSPDFVPFAKLIATFENHGTPWVKEPIPVRPAFAFGRVKATAPLHPKLAVTKIGGFSTGTWTPTIAAFTPGDLSVTYGTRNGQWMRIGQFVYASCDIVTSAFTHTSAAGQVTVNGLPYNANDDYAGPLDFQGINKTGGYTSIKAMTAANSRTVAFECTGMGLNIASLAITDMPSGGTVVLRFSILYQTNDP
jgi:hypothetical protein